METTSSPLDTKTHSASLLAYLNHQREQGIFCDCVLRPGLNSDQLYRAHRCILAASSPVLESILSSSGALVELKDLNLSDSVLPSLLDYIYTGVLPYSLSKQEYNRLLSAACQMQMKELQDALRATWLRIQGNAAGDNCSPGIVEMSPHMHTEDTCKVDFKTFIELPSSTPTSTQPTQINPVSTDPRTEINEILIKNRDANGRTTLDSASLNGLNTFSTLESIEVGNTKDYRELTAITQQGSMWNKCDYYEINDIPGIDDRPSSGFPEPDIQKRIQEEDLLNTPKERKRRSSSSSQSPRPCCEAVPVIRHSRAATLQQPERYAWPPQDPASTLSVQLSVNSVPDQDNKVEAINTECEDQNEVQSQDTGSTLRRAKCATSRKGKKDYNSNNVLFKLSDNTSENFTYRKNNKISPAEHHGDSLVLTLDSRRGLKHQIETDLDPVPSKNRHLDCFECQRTLLTTDQSKNERTAENQDTEGDSHWEQYKVGMKREHSYSNRCLVVTDVQINKDDKSRKDDISSKSEYNRVNTTETELTVLTSQSGSANGTVSSSASKCCKVPETRKNHCPEITEPRFFLPSSTDNQANLMHVAYQGGLCEEASFQDSDHKPSKPSLSPGSDEFGDGVNAGSSAFSGQRSLSRHLTGAKEDPLHINTKQKELRVSCQHGFVGMDTAKILSHENVQRKEGSSVSTAESFNETDRQRERIEESLFDVKLCRTGVWVIQNSGVMEDSRPTEDETKISSDPACSPLSEPDWDQASRPSEVAACMPSTLPASMPTDRSANLSSPNHQPFQCSLCDRSFSQRGSLNRHVRSHLGVRPFPCPCCPMTFSRQYRVTEHMRVHQRCVIGNGTQKIPDSSGKKN